MSFVRYVDRSAVVAFCPLGPYYLAGSAASSIDLNFTASSSLEIFKVDFSTPPPELPPAGAPLTVGERFHSVAWGKTGAESKQHPLGLVAGGLEDGVVSLWDPQHIIEGSDPSLCEVTKLKRHETPVRALDFNPNLTHFLATGSTEPELCLWDLNKPSAPIQPTTPNPQVKSGGETDFTCTKWNQKVPQILASCTAGGKTIIQDHRRLKPVGTLQDLSSSRRCSVLEWNPERPTQVLVASEDDRTPTVQVWDLRNSASPLSELVGHGKGILSMSCSPHDPRLLLTCAKDSRTYCWDVQTSSVIAELPPLGAWHLHVQWSPIFPGLFSVSSFDGRIGLCSFGALIGISPDGQTPPGPVSVVPQWMNRPGGLSFGFGGKLAGVVNIERTVTDQTSGKTKTPVEAFVTVRQISVGTEIVPQTDAFQYIICSDDRDQMVEYCQKKKDAENGSESETWELLGLMFSPDAKRQLLTHLGFEHVDLPHAKTSDENGGGQASENTTSTNLLNMNSGIDAAQDFFENLAGEDVATPKLETKPAVEPRPKKPEILPGENEDGIQKELLVRNYDSAIDLCLKARRYTDALLIAHVAGPKHFNRVMHKYMDRNPKPYMPLLSAVAANDFHHLVKSRDLGEWKETLAMLIAYIDDGPTWTSLCDALGMRLFQTGDIHSASLCFICSGNVEKAVGIWASAGTGNLEKMQDIIEKAFFLTLAVPQPSISTSLCTIVHNYAQVLASQGAGQKALEYLDLIQTEQPEDFHILRDRIYGSGLVAQPDNAWKQKPSYNAPQDSNAGQGYGEVTDYGAYPPQASYQEGYSSGYGGYATGSYQQQPPVPQFTPQQPPAPQFTPQQPPVPQFTPQQPPPQALPVPQHPYVPPSQLEFQPDTAPPPAASGVFTPSVPARESQSARFAPPSFQPPPAFQPAPVPPTIQPTQHSVAAPPPQAFVPGAVSTTAKPHAFTPGTTPAGRATTPVSPSHHKPSAEPSIPHDISALNADTSNVQPQFKNVVTHLRTLFTKFESASLAPSQKRIVTDTSKRVGILFWDLNQRIIKPEVAEKVMRYAQALVSGDTEAATQVLADLTETAWDETSSRWLSSFKRLIRLAQTIK